MGGYVGRLIAARVAGGAPPPPFRYRHLGDRGPSVATPRS
jgi:hypothetical protein